MKNHSLNFFELLKNDDISTAVTQAKKGKLTYGEVSEGLYYAFCENLPKLWIAIADNNPVEPLNLLNMMEENAGCLYVEMVRLWLSCKPTQDLIDECLTFVSWTTEADIRNGANITDRDDINYTTIKSLDEKETLLWILFEAGADAKDVQRSFILDNRFDAVVKLVEKGIYALATLPYFLKHDKLDLAEKVYATKPHDEWIEHLLGNDSKTDAWLLSKPASSI